MKLNLAADYGIGGKRFAFAFSIDASNNLAGLQRLTALEFPTDDPARPFVAIAPDFLSMCASARRAEEVARLWNDDYRKQGRLYDCKTPVDAGVFGGKNEESEAR